MNEANKYIYEFLSPIVVEESFIIEEQDYYVNYISNELFDKINFIIKDYMNSLGEKGLASFLNDFLSDKIDKIIMFPILSNNKLYCKTMVVSNNNLSELSIGILLDFLEDEFMNRINNKLSIIDIKCNINNIDYYNKIYKYLQINNLQYTVRLNFYDYNTFFIKKIE